MISSSEYYKIILPLPRCSLSVPIYGVLSSKIKLSIQLLFGYYVIKSPPNIKGSNYLDAKNLLD